MINVPLKADVECSDGRCGKSVTVIVDPTGPKVTHIVVQTEGLSADQRLVPIAQVVETTSSLVRLDCSKEDLAGMEPFLEARYVGDQWPDPGYWYSMADVYMEPYAMPVDPMSAVVFEEKVPPGELAVHRGTWVEASDGYVGKVGELVVDPESGLISHFSLQEGHLWGKKEIVLPLAAIDRVADDAVYLTLDKKAIDQLPTLPLRRRYDKDKVASKDVELLARVFDRPGQASEALDFVEDLHRRKTLKILNAAVLAKDQEGAVSVLDTRDMEPKRGGLLGAVTGGLIGLLGGPIGVVVGALVGAGAGGLATKWIDMGFSDKFLSGLQQHLQPGTSALVLLVEHEWGVKAAESLSGLGGVVFRQALTDELVRSLMEPGETKE